MSEKESKFKQLCVWPNCYLAEDQDKNDFEKTMLEHMNVRVKFEKEVITLSDKDEMGDPVLNTGGRHDLFFYVHNEDVMKFAVPRLQFGIRWWEDVVDNKSHLIYPEEIIKKYKKTW